MRIANGRKGSKMIEPSNGTTEAPAAELDEEQLDQLWIDAVATVTTKAYERMPDTYEAIEHAYNLILQGKVHTLDNGTYEVATELEKGKQFWIVGARCECPQWAETPKGYCTHKLAALIHLRATQLIEERLGTAPEAPSTQTPLTEPVAASEPARACPIPAEHIVTIQGQRFVRFVGLLQVAHEHGLLALSAEWTFNDAELSLAHAVATFSDGRRFEESGDASPANVTKKVAVHFRRVALTRAKARALRDALGCDLVSVEESSE
jgi:hypothetical protein